MHTSLNMLFYLFILFLILHHQAYSHFNIAYHHLWQDASKSRDTSCWVQVYSISLEPEAECRVGGVYSEG